MPSFENYPLLEAVHCGYADGRADADTCPILQGESREVYAVARAVGLAEANGSRGMSTNSYLAETAGLKAFDTALPMDWYDDVHKVTGIWPQNLGFVWSYDVKRNFGEPVPLTKEALALLERYEEAKSGVPA